MAASSCFERRLPCNKRALSRTRARVVGERVARCRVLRCRSCSGLSEEEDRVARLGQGSTRISSACTHRRRLRPQRPSLPPQLVGSPGDSFCFFAMPGVRGSAGDFPRPIDLCKSVATPADASQRSEPHAMPRRFPLVGSSSAFDHPAVLQHCCFHEPHMVAGTYRRDVCLPTPQEDSNKLTLANVDHQAERPRSHRTGPILSACFAPSQS